MADKPDRSSQPASTGLIVLGMHRSGTSALTGALGLCGAWLGQDRELTGANFQNPKGFWERRDIRTVCDRLLHAADADWWKVAAFEPSAIPHPIIVEQGRVFRQVVDELKTHGIWAVKEPRLCLLFEILRPFILKSVCIHVYRNPLDVAQSLRMRNGFGLAEGLALWEAYNRSALRASAGLPRVVVSYEMLVSHTQETLGSLLRDLSSLDVTNLALPPAEEIEDFITPSLHHQRTGTAETVDFLLPSQKDLWFQLQSGEALHTEPSNGLSNVVRQHLRDVESRRSSVDQLTAKAKMSDAETSKLASALQAQEARTGELEAELAQRDAEAKELASKLQAQDVRTRVIETSLAERTAEAKEIASRLQAEKVRTDDLAAKLEASDIRLHKLKDTAMSRAKELDKLASKGKDFELRIASLEAQLSAVYASHSWRFTAPLRAGSLLVKRTFRRLRSALRLLWWLTTGQFTRAAKALLPRYQRYVPSYVKMIIPRTARQAVKMRLKADPGSRSSPTQNRQERTVDPDTRGPGRNVGLKSILGYKVARARFGRELQRIVDQELSPAFADALRKSESQLAKIVARSQSLTNRPLVSIIMPTHNRAEIIGGSIATVLEQEYPNWELLVCDDGSTDDTEAIVARFFDHRIKYLKLPKQGAAAARNAGLRSACGGIVAYLDSDNFWHPAFLSTIVLVLLENSGHSAVYTNFIDFHVDRHGRRKIRSFKQLPFDHERLLKKPYIDLNSFAHRRELYECFGGFGERLTRRQDYDLILKYTWLRDPLHVSCLATLYQRNDRLTQITRAQREDRSCISIIERSVAGYLKDGLPLVGGRPVKKVTVLSWDLCRNHFSKPFALAEALSKQYDVQLISFRFFQEEIFPPLQGVTPNFETLYLPGMQFPAFFESMKRALAAIRGDVIYVVKPRLSSFGLALLANYQRATPIVLEINDLETVVSSPQESSNHTEAALNSVDLGAQELLNPYSDLWSQVMHPLARQMPVLVTHNHAIDQEFGRRCLYMRNLKDEQVYDPAAYDREEVRAELGFNSEDRVILFGGLIRKHKGIYELVELVDRLDDPRYKLLFAGSRPTPDQKKLAARYGDRVRILPPQDREAMARINYAADMVVLWLDPDVPVSHYQMPYKATDAFAMGPTVIANDISDLGLLARQGYLHVVPFGDWETMARVVQDIFDNPGETTAKREASRRLFLRQFSYAAARGNFQLAAGRALAQSSGRLPAAEAFAQRFNEFYQKAAHTDHDFIRIEGQANCRKVRTETKVDGYGKSEEDKSIVIVDAKNVAQLSHEDAIGVAVVMPSIDTQRGLKTARILVKRAGMKTTVFVVEDTLRQGFIRTLNDTAQRLNVAYLVYLAEDAFPGLDWLRIAYEALEKAGKGLLAFNDGKWHGRIAGFGIVRMQWAQKVYGGPILFPGYRAHKADNELTVIARLMNDFIYEPTATLVELDASKAFEGGEGPDGKKQTADRNLFYERFHGSFDARFRWRDVAPYKDEYLNLRKLRAERGEPYEPPDDAIVLLDIGSIASLSWWNPEGIAVIMPCIDPKKGRATARLLVQRAGIAARVYVVEDSLRQGFITTLNDTAAQLDVKYIVYLAEDAFPGENWLRTAHARLEETGKALLAFNCGKWHGRIAAFGMVRKGWVQQMYGDGVILHPAYKAHKADNELTVIARTTRQFVYEPNSVLIENDSQKVFKENIPEDKAVFHRRFRAGFDGLVPLKELKPLAQSYFVPLDPESEPEREGTGSDSGDDSADEDDVAKRGSDKPLPFFRSPLSASHVRVLKEEYAAKGLDKSPDTFVLYRIIGNDLQPRHRKGQSRSNLRFILENEQDFEHCEKRFIVNRIFDPEEESAIIQLLAGNSAKYSVIPFDREQYSKIGFDLEALNPANLLSSRRLSNFHEVRRQRVQLALYRLKNNYVMNNNGARNFSLTEGRTLAKWVLPFDGNCFITPDAWEGIRSDICASPYLKYFVVPMTRVSHNTELLCHNFKLDPVEEPQIVFRMDAKESFNEGFCYGRRPKVELFWRLQVAGRWDAYRDDRWDQERPPASTESGEFGVAGWVARLSSGMSDLESQDAQGADRRYLARSDAILTTLRTLDYELAGGTSATMTSLRARVLEKEKARADEPGLSSTLGVLKVRAEQALRRGPYSVTEKTTLPPSGDRQDYWHPAPYWWPDPEKPDGLPYIRKDGERVPGTQMYEPDSDKYDRTRLQLVFDDSLTLGLAWSFFGDKRYAEAGASILERFFVDQSTRMKPHLKYAQVRIGHNKNQGAPTGLIEAKDMYFYLDAVHLFENAGVVSDGVSNTFRGWLAAYLEWLLSSGQGKAERAASNNHGTCYDLQVAAIASFLGDKDIVYETLARAQARISEQFAPDGHQPEELKRKTTAHYCCFNLQSWGNLAELASRWNVDLWDYETPTGAGLRSAARWLIAYMDEPWPYEQIDAFDSERFLPIWFAAREHVDDLVSLDRFPESPYAVKPVYFPHDGIRPYWNLASHGATKGSSPRAAG